MSYTNTLPIVVMCDECEANSVAYYFSHDEKCLLLNREEADFAAKKVGWDVQYRADGNVWHICPQCMREMME